MAEETNVIAIAAEGKDNLIRIGTTKTKDLNIKARLELKPENLKQLGRISGSIKVPGGDTETRA